LVYLRQKQAVGSEIPCGVWRVWFRTGFEILKGGNHGRSVKYRDRTFVEGHLESWIAEIDDNNSEAVGDRQTTGHQVLFVENLPRLKPSDLERSC